MKTELMIKAPSREMSCSAWQLTAFEVSCQAEHNIPSSGLQIIMSKVCALITLYQQYILKIPLWSVVVSGTGGTTAKTAAYSHPITNSCPAYNTCSSCLQCSICQPNCTAAHNADHTNSSICIAKPRSSADCTA